MNKTYDEGIVHFWDLPTNFVILNSEFKQKLMDKFMSAVKTKYRANKLTNIPRCTISKYLNESKPMIRIKLLLKIINIINEDNFNKNTIEQEINWIGFINSQGIKKPKLPFNFNSRQGARFLAAICNDGWISDGVYYSNTDEDLRNSVINDVLYIIGGNKDTIKVWIKTKDQYLSFPSVVRDILILLTNFRGVKCENDPLIPKFIQNKKECILGWIEQTIADEGCVNYIPKVYRREIRWKRSYDIKSLNYEVTKDELNMLDKIGIQFNLYNNFYITDKGKERVQLVISITKRINILKLRKLIIIPCKRKDKIFNSMTKGFVRYKEPLKIKNAIVRICNKEGHINSIKLKKAMGYKETNPANKWLKYYTTKGLLKCIKSHSYDPQSIGRVPSKYILNKP